MKVSTVIQLNDEELKRWNDAYDIMCKVYEALPHECKAEATIEKAIEYFEEFAENYMED